MKFTLAMALMQDRNRSWMTAMSGIIHHPAIADVVVVDNDPDSEEGKATAEFVNKLPFAKYVPMAEPKGTSAPRNMAVRQAEQEHVLVVDSHVLLFPGAVASLAQTFADMGSDCPDLFHGPMIYDHSVRKPGPGVTHMNLQMRAQMWGTWGSAWRSPSGLLFSCRHDGDNRLAYVSLCEADGRQHRLDPDPLDGRPPIGWSAHEKALYAAGCDHPVLPFLIPAHGFGMFATRRDSWLGFPDDARGFGGEECTTHRLYYTSGRKVWCVPGLKWCHDFGRVGKRPDEAAGLLTVWNKARNYVLGINRYKHMDPRSAEDLEMVRQEFDKPGLMDPHEWPQLVAGMKWPTRPGDPTVLADNAPADARPDTIIELVPAVPASRTQEEGKSKCGCEATGRTVEDVSLASLDNLYTAIEQKSQREIGPYMNVLRKLAAGQRVVDLGARNGYSSVAFLAGGAKSLHCVEKIIQPGVKKLESYAVETPFTAVEGDSREVEIPECDLLYLASDPPTADQRWAELQKHAKKVSRYIVLRDYVCCGESYGGKPGLIHAVRSFLKENPEWTSILTVEEGTGLIVLSKDPADKQQPPHTMRKALNFGMALGRIASHYARNGKVTVPEEVYQSRLDTCLMCPIRNHDVCGDCGCVLAYKAAAASERCGIKPEHGEPKWLELPLAQE